MILPGFGEEAQQKLERAKVLVVGAGGLGCPVLSYLAAAGVGTIGIADADVVSLSNLQRQVLFGAEDVGKLKAEVAQEKLSAQYPQGRFISIPEKMTSSNALRVLKDFDLVVDGTDNFPAKYLLNDACILLNKVLVFGSILRFEGQVAVFNHHSGIHYRDLFPEPPQQVPNCAEAGVLGALCGIVGSVQANEAIKVLAGLGETLDGKLWRYNALDNTSQVYRLSKDLNVKPVQALIDYDLFCGRRQEGIREITAAELETMLQADPHIQLIDVREAWEKDEADEWGGRHIPLAELKDRAGELDPDRPIVIYCQSGNRSRMAATLLGQLGFVNLLTVIG